ncbi:MAG: alpha/beta hydrolase [Caldilineaceae bacterium]
MMEFEQPTARSIWLWPEDGFEAAEPGFRPWFDPYPLPGETALGAVLICPGGGYARRAYHEGILIAECFNALGFHAFVVHYSVAPHRHPQPLRDVARALRMIRQRAGEWRVDPEHIAVCGFSAGGHLTASLGVHFDHAALHADTAHDGVSSRPDALILCYPVISSGEFRHQGSFDNLLGEHADEAARAEMSLELQVNAHTPPAFLWHTVEDAGVPVENSLLFAQSLRRCGVPFEMHIYPHGRHGLGLSAEDPHVATWVDLCAGWLRGRGW